MYRDTAVESLTLAIELFNRPSDVARDHAIVMMLAHSFEMILKAAIFETRGKVRDTNEELSHSLSRCIAIAVDDLQIVTHDEQTLLGAIKQDRDAATHDLISMSEQMLWIHMRGGITIFRRILQDSFGQSLSDLLPQRTIPVSASPPTDLQAVIESEMVAVTKLLAPGTRRVAEAHSRLRPLLSLDGSPTGRLDQPTELEVGRAERALRAGKPWQTIFPGLATIQFTDLGSQTQEVALRITSDPNATPVRRADYGEAALAYGKSNPFDEYGLKLSEFGLKLGLSQYEGHALIHALGLKDDDRAYFVRLNRSGSVKFQGLSARALELARLAMAEPDFDLAAVRSAYGSRASQ